MMGSLSRKMRRRNDTKREKEAKRDVAQKMNMFDRMPDECSACESAFDKNDKQMVMSWNVVVPSGEKTVRLYCPECWDKAKNIIKEYAENERSTDL
jgi:hypothetical protein